MTLATIITSIENFIDPRVPSEGEAEVDVVEASDESDDEQYQASGKSKHCSASTQSSLNDNDFEQEMRDVHGMFVELQAIFEGKFKKMWA